MSNPQVPSKEAQDRMAVAAAQSPVATPVAAPIQAAQIADPAQLEETIKRIIAEAQSKRPSSSAAEEPDWATMTEAVALDVNSPMYIPVIEHEIPAYLDVRLGDPEYMPVWVNRDQRRFSAKQAEGYELLKAEHLAKDFKAPLKFDSEGLYTYADVVCMRVHKRILLGKRRRLVELSTGQLRGLQAKERAKTMLENEVISKDPALDSAFGKGSMAFYQP